VDALERALEALRARGCAPRRLGPSKARSLCPIHRDVRPSLAIDRRDGNVLLYCFAGCATKTVIDAIGLKWSDLRDGGLPMAPKVPAGVVATYEYTDLRGEPLARKIRRAPKSFMWQRRTVDGGWRRGLQDLKPGLFGLDYLVEAKRPLLVEGEKAALLLRARGFDATCPPAGASSWQTNWSEALWRAGAAEVVILPDADRPGRQHAERVAADLHTWRPMLPETTPGDPWPSVTLRDRDNEAAALNVRVVSLPGLRHGEDVHDWFTVHGHTSTDLRDLIEDTPQWAPLSALDRRRMLTRDRVRRLRARRRAVAAVE
jgi:hypothetical protein